MQRRKAAIPGVWAAVLVAFVASSATEARSVTTPQTVERPIIAAAMAEASRYDGVRVAIYGLVTSIEAGDGQFAITDVSQKPLKVRASGLETMKLLDQVEVEGVIRVRNGALVLDADRISPTKVLGGGGCC